MIKKMYRSFILLVTSFCLLSTTIIPVHASENMGVGYATVIEPRNTNIKYSTISLSLSDGVAKCSASVTGYSSNTYSVSIYMYLQKYSNGTWSNIASWSDSADDYTLSIYKTKTVSSGRYRLKASYYAQNENIVKYSAEQVY